jgi:CdiI immunity protein
VNVDDIDPRDPAWDALWTLFAGYFHQDFDAEYDDWRGAIHAYLAGNSRANIVRTIEQIEYLLENLENDEEVRHCIEKLGLDYHPDIGSLTFRDWLVEIASVLRGK